MDAFNIQSPTMKRKLDDISNIAEEITTPKELFGLLSSPIEPCCYDGFEPSGTIHIAQGLMKAHYIKVMVESGFVVKIWIADIFAQLNKKLNGDMKKIRVCGEYMIEVWKFYLNKMGVDMNKVHFIWASDAIKNDSDRYWSIVMHISTKFGITRMKKCTPILGRDECEKKIEKLYEQAETFEKSEQYKEACDVYKQIKNIEENESMPLSYLMYAAMQCADIYFLEADVCQLGKDQRKVNMLAREYCEILIEENPSFTKKRVKPIIISHHMLMGLQQNDDQDIIKMSKSNPESAIFMSDSKDDVVRKIKKAFCKPKNIEKNPVLEYVKYIILPIQKQITIQKPVKFGGEKFVYYENEYDKLSNDYTNGVIHPSELKTVVTDCINELLEPLREHFQTNEYAKLLLNQLKNIHQNKK